MDILLVPGLWLNAGSWRDVVPVLERAGHRARPLTLPGTGSLDADRAGIGLPDHVDAVVAEIDAAVAASADDAASVVVVGHSTGCAIAYAAVDARPDRVAHVVCVGGFPVGDGLPIAGDVPADGDGVPLPPWSAFEEADLAGLDEASLAAFREQAVPWPVGVVRGRQTLRDERRHGVPVTMVCPEYTSETLRGWVDTGAPLVAELARLASVRYVDLPTGRWPQLSRPHDLARVVLAVVDAPTLDARVDELGRVEPPEAGTEVDTLLGFLDYQRVTLAWKCTGVDAAGMRATVGVSRITLGGLLKHMAFVEDYWFSSRLAGHGLRPPWDAVDWSADPDWEWDSAVDDTVDDLATLWHAAVARSRRRVLEALGSGGLDQLAGDVREASRVPSLRWILVHMIEEYARHNGHADLIREAVDGVVGE